MEWTDEDRAAIERMQQQTGIAKEEDLIRLACWWLSMILGLDLDPRTHFVITQGQANQLKRVTQIAAVRTPATTTTP